MSLLWMQAAWAGDPPGTPADRLVLMALADEANDDGYCRASMRVVAEKAGVSVRAAQYAVRRLEAEGFLTVERGDGRGHASVFRLIPKAAQIEGIEAMAQKLRDMMNAKSDEAVCTLSPSQASGNKEEKSERVQDLHPLADNEQERVQNLHPFHDDAQERVQNLHPFDEAETRLSARANSNINKNPVGSSSSLRSEDVSSSLRSEDSDTPPCPPHGNQGGHTHVSAQPQRDHHSGTPEVDLFGQPVPPRRKPKRPMPEDFVPSLDMAQNLMLELGLEPEELDYAFQRMREHAYATDRRQADWNRAFANWVRKAVHDGEIGPNSRRRGFSAFDRA